MEEIKKKTTKAVVGKAVSKPVVKKEAKIAKPTIKKEAEVKAAFSAPKTMRNRSGLHTLNARKAKPTEKAKGVKAATVGVNGVAMGDTMLSGEVFGQEPNKNLIAQAVRVYLANQRQGTASSKTRGEVIGSTKKIYRQKGTGRARHGASKAPIFVGGGIAHGPHPHDFSLKFPKKMKKQALVSALSEKAQAGLITIVDGQFSGKTKEVATLMRKVSELKKGKINRVLLIVDKSETAARAAHNVGGVEIETALTVSTYGVVISKTIIFMKSAVEDLEKRLSN